MRKSLKGLRKDENAWIAPMFPGGTLGMLIGVGVLLLFLVICWVLGLLLAMVGVVLVALGAMHILQIGWLKGWLGLIFGVILLAIGVVFFLI